MSYYSEVLADLPEYLFGLDEPSGAFVDLSGNGVSLSESGGSVTRGVTGPYSGALGIQTSGVQLRTDYSALSKTQMTTHGWFNLANSGYNLLVNGRGGVGLHLDLAVGASGFGSSAGQLVAFFNTTSYWSGKHSTALVNDGFWHHLAATWQQGSGQTLDPNQITLYIDGLPVTGTVESNGGGTSPTPISSEHIQWFTNIAGAVKAHGVGHHPTKLPPGRIKAHFDGFAASSGNPIVVVM